MDSRLERAAAFVMREADADRSISFDELKDYHLVPVAVMAELRAALDAAPEPAPRCPRCTSEIPGERGAVSGANGIFAGACSDDFHGNAPHPEDSPSEAALRIAVSAKSQFAARVAAPQGGGAIEDRAVAWAVKHQDGWMPNVYTEKRAAESWVYPGGPYRVVPLYAHPAPPAPDAALLALVAPMVAALLRDAESAIEEHRGPGQHVGTPKVTVDALRLANVCHAIAAAAKWGAA